MIQKRGTVKPGRWRPSLTSALWAGRYRLLAQPHVALHAQLGPHAHVGPQQHSPAFACVLVEQAQPPVEHVLQLHVLVDAMVMVRVSSCL